MIPANDPNPNPNLVIHRLFTLLEIVPKDSQQGDCEGFQKFQLLTISSVEKVTNTIKSLFKIN